VKTDIGIENGLAGWEGNCTTKMLNRCQKAKGERKELINISQGRKQLPVYRSKFTVSSVFIHVSGKKPCQ
jgi:hypothetical protein